MNTSVPECVQKASSGSARPTGTASMAPPTAPNTAATRKATKRVRCTSTPRYSALRGLSRCARTARPKGERTTRHISPRAAPRGRGSTSRYGPTRNSGLVQLLEREAEQRRARHAHALVAAGERVELEQEGVEQHAEGQGEHAEEDLRVARAEGADRQRDEEPGRRGGQQRRLEAFDAPHPGGDRRGIGADGHEHRMPEGHEPAIAEQQVEPEQRHAVAEDGQQQRGAVLPEDEGRRREDRDRARASAVVAARFTSRASRTARPGAAAAPRPPPRRPRAVPAPARRTARRRGARRRSPPRRAPRPWSRGRR